MSFAKHSSLRSSGQALCRRVTWPKPDPSALLYPAEFRMITTPGCIAKNSVYLQCAGNAYRSSSDGAGCAAVAQPDVCNDPSQWLK